MRILKTKIKISITVIKTFTSSTVFQISKTITVAEHFSTTLFIIQQSSELITIQTNNVNIKIKKQNKNRRT